MLLQAQPQPQGHRQPAQGQAAPEAPAAQHLGPRQQHQRQQGRRRQRHHEALHQKGGPHPQPRQGRPDGCGPRGGPQQGPEPQQLQGQQGHVLAGLVGVIEPQGREGQQQGAEPALAGPQQLAPQLGGEPEAGECRQQRGQVGRPAAGPQQPLAGGDQPLHADGAVVEGLVPPWRRQPVAAERNPAGLQQVVALVVGQGAAGGGAG